MMGRQIQEKTAISIARRACLATLQRQRQVESQVAGRCPEISAARNGGVTEQVDRVMDLTVMEGRKCVVGDEIGPERAVGSKPPLSPERVIDRGRGGGVRGRDDQAIAEIRSTAGEAYDKVPVLDRVRAVVYTDPAT